MHTYTKRPYSCPKTINAVILQAEDRILFGSIVDFLNPVQTTGQEVENMFDYSTFTDEQFNHSWQD